MGRKNGCNTGGTDGIISEDSIAQKVSMSIQNSHQ